MMEGASAFFEKQTPNSYLLLLTLTALCLPGSAQRPIRPHNPIESRFALPLPLVTHVGARVMIWVPYHCLRPERRPKLEISLLFACNVHVGGAATVPTPTLKL